MPALKKILLVDDEILLLNFLERNVSKHSDSISDSINVKVLTAGSGKKAIAILCEEEIDLVVTDFIMPDITGLDLLYRIRSQWPNIEIIIMTGHCTDELKNLAGKNGCLHIFEKPFVLSEIKTTIFDLLIKQEKEKGFTGIFKNVNLTDLIQMCCLDGVTKSIRIRKGREEGYIHISNGEILHAACGDIKGQDAFYKILGWPMGSFETLELMPKVEKNITADWQYLLLEGARKTDETNENESDFDENLQL